MATLGGIGGVLGVFADRHDNIPIATPDRAIHFSTIFTPKTQAAFTTIGF